MSGFQAWHSSTASSNYSAATGARGKQRWRSTWAKARRTWDSAAKSTCCSTASRASAVKLEVLDDDGTPTTGQFTFRDTRGRVYPARSRRQAPDFFFHDQVYRQHGEVMLLPAGKYHVTYTRGPEYLVSERDIDVPGSGTHTERFRMKRWINLAEAGWFSGDHHVHAAGCAHYSSPTQGVQPADMMRHIVGEDLNVGCVLTWGPCWYHQKQNFDGKVHSLSTARNLMRYDVEVSGFPSSHAGHVVLLRLTEDDYPGTKRIEEWPSWNLPVLKWGKGQGGVVGYAHSGLGLRVSGKSLPTFEMPAFDGIGANEYIVDVTHDACDFISAVDTPFVWELNIWYHTLNCGFTTRISGETDFPCMYGERVGLGRGYVKMDPDQPLDFDHWVEGIRDGRSYCCDGLTHLFDFQINGLGVGEPGDGERNSFLAVKRGEKLKIKCKAAGLLVGAVDAEPHGDARPGRRLGRTAVLAHRAGQGERHAPSACRVDRQRLRRGQKADRGRRSNRRRGIRIPT